MSDYRKHCYWLDLQSLKKARNQLEQEGIRLVEEPRIPCRVLRSSLDVAYLPPSAWNGFCKRKTSWYWKSDKAKKFLVVSSTPLRLTNTNKAIVIRYSKFHPVRFPSPEETEQLAKSRVFEKTKPRLWDKVAIAEWDIYQRWLDRFHVADPLDFEKIFVLQSANHANFLAPKFFKRVGENMAPYSIAESYYVCSSCVEFFNIVGEQHRVKFVVPCLGAVQFARLPLNDYLRVETK